MGRTVAGAPSPQAPIRDTPGTSSSSLGSIGSPASNGTNPRLTRPAAVDCWPQAGFADYNSSGVESGTMTVYNNNSGAPAGSRQALPLPTALPVRKMLGRDGLSPAGELGPTFLLTRGGSATSTEGVVAPIRLQQLGITSMLDLAEAFTDEEEVRSAIGAADQTAQQMAVAAWAQSRRRAPYIVRALAVNRHTATAPPTCMQPQLATAHTTQPCPELRPLHISRLSLSPTTRQRAEVAQRNKQWLQ